MPQNPIFGSKKKMSSFVHGISAYITSFRVINKHRLWLYFWIPALMSMLLGVLILRSAWAYGDNIGDVLTNWYPWERGAKVIGKVADVLGGMGIVVIALLLFRYIIMIIAAPFMSLLSEQLEKALYPSDANPGFNPVKMLKDIVRGLRLALRNVIRELLFTVIIALLGVIVPILLPLVPVLIILVQAYYAGFGNADFTLERYKDVSGSIRFARSHRWMLIGNGLIFVLLLMTVVGFIVALPLGTVAAAIVSLPHLKQIQGQTT